MLYYRIYSVFCFLGWFVLFVFLVSHPLFRCRYVTVVCLLLPDSSVLAHISRLSRMCRTLLVFRFRRRRRFTLRPTRGLCPFLFGSYFCAVSRVSPGLIL